MATKGTSGSLPFGSGPIWVLVLLGAALVGWIFWKHSQTAPPKPAVQARSALPAPKPQPTQSPKTVVQVANTTPRPAIQTTQDALVLIPTTRMRPAQPAATNVASDPQSPAMRERVLRAQIALVRQGISSGALDGLLGSQTRAALRAFQQKTKLPETGNLDTNTFEALVGSATNAEPYSEYTVTESDLSSLQPLGETWLAKSKQSSLAYETILEMVSERSQSHPNLIRSLNPAVNWASVPAGTVIKTPNIELPVVNGRAAYVKVHLAARVMEAFDADDNLIAHFPCSIGKRMEQRPAGELHVVVIAHNPNYTFDPEVFPESAEARELGRKLILAPGPNSPVGTRWIGLDKPGYGIHGTPRPEQVGRTESHGCFRLANWNAEFLARIAWVGMPVFVE